MEHPIHQTTENGSRGEAGTSSLSSGVATRSEAGTAVATVQYVAENLLLNFVLV